MIVLVPAYEPDTRLVTLVADLREAGHQVLVVDDGSGPDHATVFAATARLGAQVLTHPRNRGKGQALRTGLAHVLPTRPGQDVVCADCDGQHTPTDIARVAARLRAVPDDTLVLGTRRFTGEVPARSRFGNTATRLLFRAVTGTAVHDTQTGLRGYPAAMLPWLLSVPGDRFEYELEILLRATTSGRRIVEEDIATVYLQANASSHFRPVIDSLRVCVPMLTFAASSLTAFTLDTALLLVLHATTGNLLTSVLGARTVSSAVNFQLNRHLVFRRPRQAPWRAAAARYGGLVVGLLTVNYLLLAALTTLGVPLLPAKVLTELALFATSFEVQRRFVFADRPPRDDHVPEATPALPTMSPARTTPRGKAPQCPSTTPTRPPRPASSPARPPAPLQLSSPASGTTSPD